MTIDLTDLAVLSRVLDRTESGTLTATIDGLTVTVEWPQSASTNGSANAPAQAEVALPSPHKPTDKADRVYLRAPMVGMLNDSGLNVANGDNVTAGDTLLEMQTGDRMVPVKTTVTGTVIAIRSYEERELIHCGHWLIAIKPT